MDEQHSTLRYRVFVDYWNFELSLRELLPGYRLDWKELPHVLIRHASELVSPGQKSTFAGMAVYLSHGIGKDTDRKLKNWAVNVLDRFPGTSVDMVERRRVMSYPKCPTCYEEVPTCASCGSDMRGTHEKGVDTRIATDMIRLAWEGTYDVGVLVSSDADFVPVVNFLDTKNTKVVHVGVGDRGHHLAKESWGSINFKKYADEAKR